MLKFKNYIIIKIIDMKKLIILLIISGITNMYSQNFPINKYKTIDYYKNNEKAVFGHAWGYINSNFINTTYATNRKNGNIKEELDLNINGKLFMQYQGFMFEINAFQFNISVNEDYQIQTGLINDNKPYDNFKHRGYDTFLSYNLFESSKNRWIQERFKTFAGLGYQKSYMTAFQEGEQITNTKLNYPMWKVGVQFKLLESVGLFAEYKQNITDETNNKKYSQLCGGLLFQFNKGY